MGHDERIEALKKRKLSLGLKSRPKDEPKPTPAKEESVWDRSLERKKPGRKKGPETFQLHPRMTLETAEKIIDLANDRGMTQGEFLEMVFIEWATNDDI